MTTFASPDDFNFLHGRWDIQNRRLMSRLCGAEDWTEFPATMDCQPRMKGAANIDETDFPTLGFSGVTLRLFDVAARRWSIYWINSGSGRLQPPVHGGFDGDAGTFYGVDDDEGRAVEVRFDWRRLGPDKARWSQAFRIAGLEGAWETNWVMEFRRQA